MNKTIIVGEVLGEINYEWDIEKEKELSTYEKYIKDFVEPCHEEILKSIKTVSDLVEEEKKK